MSPYWIVLVAGWVLLYFSLRRLNRVHKKPSGSHIDELHHGYIGGLTALGILIALTFPKEITIALLILALALLVEDGISHLIQGYKEYGWRGLFWRVYRWILLQFKKDKKS